MFTIIFILPVFLLCIHFYLSFYSISPSLSSSFSFKFLDLFTLIYVSIPSYYWSLRRYFPTPPHSWYFYPHLPSLYYLPFFFLHLYILLFILICLCYILSSSSFLLYIFISSSSSFILYSLHPHLSHRYIFTVYFLYIILFIIIFHFSIYPHMLSLHSHLHLLYFRHHLRLPYSLLHSPLHSSSPIFSLGIWYRPFSFAHIAALSWVVWV